jgi:AcrR family transcriptional regulator
VADVDRATDLRARLIDAGLAILRRDGAAELTVRRIAEAAGTSTMGVYTRFGGRVGVLESIYDRGFVLLREAFEAVSPAPEAQPDPLARILDLGLAYRRFGLANPALYAFLFERPLPDFDPDPAARWDALRSTFGVLVDAVRAAVEAGQLAPGPDPVHTAYLIWCTAHGMVSLELTHAVRRPLPGWFVSTPEDGERVFRAGIRAILSGLSVSPPAGSAAPAR